MAKLYFKYGSMGSSKTAQALITKYNYEENGMHVWLIKPAADERDGAIILRSRVGLEAPAEVVPPHSDIYELYRSREKTDVIIVDDIISSGQSMLEVATRLKQQGAKRVFMFATFGLFCEGLEQMDRAYEEGAFNKIFTTNLIYRTPELLSREWFAEVNMCKYVSLIIDTLNRDQSISHVLNPVERIQSLVEHMNQGK